MMLPSACPSRFVLGREVSQGFGVGKKVRSDVSDWPDDGGPERNIKRAGG